MGQLFMSQEKDKSVNNKYLFMFDLGNVVIDNIEVNDKIAEYYHLNREEYEIDYGHYVYPLMDGTIDASFYFKHVSHQFKVDIPPDSFATFFKPTINEEVRDLILSLRGEGHTVVCASNTYKGHYDIIREMGVLDLFDQNFASHEMGICKPARQFFEHILTKMNFDATNSFFIDDLPENVEMGEKLGIKSMLFVDEYKKSAIDFVRKFLQKM